MNPTVTKLLWPTLACILLFMGCKRKPRIGMGVVGWTTTSTNRNVYGIDNGSAYFGGYHEGTVIIIWTDILSCGFPIKPAWDKTGNCAKYTGFVKAPTSSKINVECYVDDSMMGSMTINQQKYDLENGGLFLIRFRAPEIRIVQINQDIYAVTPKGEDRKQLLENTPEIRAFYETPATE